MAGFTPRIAHRIDSLELVEDLIVAGHGIGLLPRGRTTRRGVSVLPLTDPSVTMRVYAVTRRGREQWPPLRAVLEQLTRADPGEMRPVNRWPHSGRSPELSGWFLVSRRGRRQAAGGVRA